MNAESRTEKAKKKKKRRKKRYFLRFIIFVIACIGAYFLLHIDYFTVDGITVAGNNEIADKEILELSEVTVGEDIFDIHPIFVERRIKENMYIEDVKVKRKLPNMVEIIITERSGKAQFAKGEKYIITDNEGLVLEIAKEEYKATLVEGVTVKKAKVDKQIETKNKDTYDKAMSIIKTSEEGDMYFKKLYIHGGHVEAYVYDKLVCKGKYSDIIDSLESGALKTVVFDLYQKDIKKGVINVGSNNYCSFTP